ncbi:ferric reduction oxidase 2 [Euphorbia peplus]|nr:ferric reduction oxidase 2 [Euphorbia peplus]
METPSSSSSEILRLIIRIISGVTMMSYFSIWVIFPTKLSGPFLSYMRKKITTTYLGSQGVFILFFCFSILFVAVLGCVYLHLGLNKKIPNHTRPERKYMSAKWKKPMLVKGPLGIVSTIELACFVMFIGLLVWYLSAYLYNNFTTRAPELAARRKEKLWETKMERTGFVLGIVGSMCLAFLLVPVTRGSSLLPLVGLTSEASIKYHIWLGHLVMGLFTAHGLCYIVYWSITNRISEVLKWDKVGVSNVAGELSLLAGLGLWVTTFPQIRQKMFELFFYAHHLYIAFIVFFIFHLGINFTVIVMLPGFYLFLIDRYLRFLQSRTSVRLVSARVLPCQTLELNFSKTPSLSYNPTSILFVNVPSISKLQWHPFSISSSSHLEPENLSVMIKSEGTWSSKLYQMLSSSSSSIDRLQVSVEGPYSPASTHFLRHETLVMVSGGSGITPFISIIRELIFASTANKSKIPQVILICSFKNSADLTMLDLLLPISNTPFTTSNLQIRIEAFVTREKEPVIQDSKLVQTVWFKPHKTDKPISAVLGPKSWLWLGAIILSSFIIFLIIIGVITQYYIYPIDHNTRKIFSYSIHSSLYMLVICVSIVTTASAAFLYNKKQNDREATHLQDIDPLGGDKESGSPLPLEPTNVHYGERPNLKRMLLECNGSSVGVLVCGSKKMRHDVAAICSSASTDNLHFESISFSW